MVLLCKPCLRWAEPVLCLAKTSWPTPGSPLLWLGEKAIAMWSILARGCVLCVGECGNAAEEH